MAKTSYNPFKMWGSWIGVILFILLFIISFNSGGSNIGSLIGVPSGGRLFIGVILISLMFPGIIINAMIYGMNSDSSLFIPALSGVIFSFLVGWGIHSIIKKVSN